MKIIIGLGNPGTQFNHTRHNAGFEALDFFAKENNFPAFELSKKYEAEISELNDVILVKPQAFMNESGKSAAAITKNKNNPEIMVVHDEIDLPLGKLKISTGSGAGGHKGVASIIQYLGNQDFARMKIGIATGDHKAEEVVLQKFSPEEKTILDEVIKKTAEAIKAYLEEGLEKAMNEFN